MRLLDTLTHTLGGETYWAIACCAFAACLAIRWFILRLFLVLADLYAAERAGEC